MPTENTIDCPALHKRRAGYPYGDRVPRTVRMLVTVTSGRIPGVEPVHTPEAKAGQTYPAWTNSHGAVVAVMDDGARLGLRPAEFEVDSWHDLAAAPAPQIHSDPIAWMVGTAFWWTREEAERDSAATGLPVIPVGPMVDNGEVERLSAACAANIRARDEAIAEGRRYMGQASALDAVLREAYRCVAECADPERGGPTQREAQVILGKIEAALFASAEPEATS